MTPSDVARFFLWRSAEDGELITPLKMQKLVYYGYAWALVLNQSRLFEERIEAWPKGPVVPSLYEELKVFGASPIPLSYLGIEPGDFEARMGDTETFPPSIMETLEEVYEEYIPLSAFELVMMSHNEKPWIEARKGYGPTSFCREQVKDADILETYVPRAIDAEEG